MTSLCWFDMLSDCTAHKEKAILVVRPYHYYMCVCVCVVSNWLYQSVGSHLTVVYLPVQLFVLQGS